MKFLPGKENFYWTQHSRIKMRQYGLSESRIRRIMRHPKRLEMGVAPKTMAGMQPAGSVKKPQEVWVMWAEKKIRSLGKFDLGGREIIVISAWRYPGISPLREPPPIPDDVWEEIRRQKKAGMLASRA